MSELATDISPYDYHRQLRDNEPVSKTPDGAVWQVARHEDVHRLMRDHETFSSDVAIRPPDEERQPSMLFSDPPIHNRLRKLVSHAFKPSHIAAQRELIEARCEALVSAIPAGREIDLVDDLAAPLPVTVIAHMLGVSDGDMLAFKEWSDAIFSNIGDILFAQASPEAERASEAMNAYFLERIEALRQQPVNHLLGRLVQTETEDGMLSDEELLSFCRLLLIAGNETTTGLITASVRIFDEMPWTFTAVREDPALIPTFIEEALRFYSPFSATVRRTTRDVELGGALIPKGELVMPLIASANRDERVFDRADEFVIDRDPNPHLAFGFGIHFCLGAYLARLEGQVAVATLTRHFSSLRVSNNDADAMSGLGGPKNLLVTFEK